MSDFTPAEINWLADETEIAPNSLHITPMRGANSSAVYKVCSDANQCFVLRVFDDAERWIRGLNLAAQEVAALAQAGRSKVNSPEVIGF